MKDYLKSQKIFAEHLYFYARKHKYVGRGIITWNPNEGFNLDALLESPKSYPERIELGRVRVSEKSDYCSIRIWTSDLGWALIPDVNIESLKFSLLEGNLSIKFSRICICETCSPVSSDSSWFGNSLYRIEANRRFRDSVIVQTQVKGEFIRQVGGNGFFHEKENTKIVGYFLDDGYFHLNWKLSKQHYKKHEAWNWSVGFQEALQVWLGETVQILKREMRRDVQKIIEVRKECKHEKLGLLSFFGEANVEKDLILHMADFFGKKKQGSEVCRNIFWQVLEASNKNLQATQELLIATTLEATMRTLYGYPVKKDDNSKGLIEKTLKGQFKRQYLSNEWRQPCNQAVSAFQRLRTRNAHPDWLSSIEGAMSSEERAQALNDMMYLCRFYGYMILALSGAKGLRPNFPEPHQNWQPAAIVTPLIKSENQSSQSQFSQINSPFDELPENSSRYKRMMALRRFYQSRFQRPKDR